MTQNVSYISKGEMLDAIKTHLNMSKNTDFARFWVFHHRLFQIGTQETPLMQNYYTQSVIL